MVRFYKVYIWTTLLNTENCRSDGHNQQVLTKPDKLLNPASSDHAWHFFQIQHVLTKPDKLPNPASSDEGPTNFQISSMMKVNKLLSNGITSPRAHNPAASKKKDMLGTPTTNVDYVNDVKWCFDTSIYKSCVDAFVFTG